MSLYLAQRGRACALLCEEVTLACRHRERHRNVSGNWIVEECISEACRRTGMWSAGSLRR